MTKINLNAVKADPTQDDPQPKVEPVRSNSDQWLDVEPPPSRRGLHLDVDEVLTRSLPKAQEKIVKRHHAGNLSRIRTRPKKSPGTNQMPEETVILKVFATEMDANMAQDVLQDEGIKAFVFKDDAGGMEPHLQRTNGVRLVVNRVDAARAGKILEPLL